VRHGGGGGDEEEKERKKESWMQVKTTRGKLCSFWNFVDEYIEGS
jgi:hypothetical protein